MSPRAKRTKKAEPTEVAAGRAKLADAGEIVQRAVEGGLLSDVAPCRGGYYGWGHLQHAKSAEAARRFRALVEGLGVRVFCEPRKKAWNGISMTLDVPGGRLISGPTGACVRFQEG